MQPVLEKAQAYLTLITENTLQANYEGAIQSGMEALNYLGIELPSENYETERDKIIEEVYALVNHQTIEQLYNIPLMEDSNKKMAVNLLITMGPPCYRYHQRLWAVIVARVVKLCIEYGHTPEIGYGYTAFAGLLIYVHRDFSTAKVFAELAKWVMDEKINSPISASVFYLMMGSSYRHWVKPLGEASEDYEKAYLIGLDSGNLQYAAYAFGHNMYCLFFQGMNLNELHDKIKNYSNFSKTRKNNWAIDLLEGGNVIVSALKDESDVQLIQDKEYLEQCNQHRNIQVLCIYNIMKAYYYYIINDYENAYQTIEEAKKKNNIGGNAGFVTLF